MNGDDPRKGDAEMPGEGDAEIFFSGNSESEISEGNLSRKDFSPRPRVFARQRLLYLLIFLHLAIALPLAFFLNIWSDEGSTLYTTEHGFLQTFQNVFADEKQAPLYFLLLSLWRALHDSIFFARLFSVICSILAIKFFYHLARKLLSAKAALFATAFLALHPFLIWASLETRVYSLVILLSVLLLKFFVEGYGEEKYNSPEKAAKTRKRAQVFYVLTSIVALYTNYYLGFLLAGCFAALVVSRRWPAAKRYFLQMLIAGLAILPLLWMIKMQFAVNAGAFQSDKSLLEGGQLLWNHILTFLLPTEIFPPEEVSLVSFIRVWLARLAILAAIILFIKKRKIKDQRILVFATISGVVLACLLFAYFLLGEIYVGIRHAAMLFAPLILFAGLVLSEIFPRKPEDAENAEGETGRRGDGEIFFSGNSEPDISDDDFSRKDLSPRLPFSPSPFLFLPAVLLAAFFGYSIYTLYPNLAKRGDWARVGRFLEEREKPNQPIIVFTTFDALVLPYHYRGANKVLPDEKFFAWELEAAPGSADAWRRQTAFIISEIPPDAPEIWLLTNEKCEIKSQCEPLENFVRANYTIIEEKDFYKEKVRLLRKK